jgi:hypothetical protein
MIHQAKSNPQLLDEQIFSERLASAISAIGHFPDLIGLEYLTPSAVAGPPPLMWINAGTLVLGRRQERRAGRHERREVRRTGTTTGTGTGTTTGMAK